MKGYATLDESKIADIIIDDEFKRLFPRLSDEDFSGLEESLCEFGCLSPLITWNNILVDGHNRFEIIKKHDLPFRTVRLEFSTREEVIIWMIAHQIQSRNLTPIQLNFYRGLHYNTEKLMRGGDRVSEKAKGQVDPLLEKGSTASKLANEYDVSQKTIKRDAQIADAIIAIGETSPEAKELILSGKANISRKRLIELAFAEKGELKDTIEQINAGTHQIRRPGTVTDSSKSGEQLTFDGFIEKIANEIDLGIKKLTVGTGETSKTAIRALIDKLERLYDSMS